MSEHRAATILRPQNHIADSDALPVFFLKRLTSFDGHVRTEPIHVHRSAKATVQVRQGSARDNQHRKSGKELIGFTLLLGQTEFEGRV